MPTHRIVFTAAALADLSLIAEYIRQDSSEAAEKVSHQIVATISLLQSLPHRFIKVGITRQLKLPVHRQVVKPYNIYYAIDESAVLVLAIRHGARIQPKRI
jgi:plasmid stabilization system protein ParE